MGNTGIDHGQVARQKTTSPSACAARPIPLYPFRNDPTSWVGPWIWCGARSWTTPTPSRRSASVVRRKAIFAHVGLSWY